MYAVVLLEIKTVFVAGIHCSVPCGEVVFAIQIGVGGDHYDIFIAVIGKVFVHRLIEPETVAVVAPRSLIAFIVIAERILIGSGGNKSHPDKSVGGIFAECGNEFIGIGKDPGNIFFQILMKTFVLLCIKNY